MTHVEVHSVSNNLTPTTRLIQVPVLLLQAKLPEEGVMPLYKPLRPFSAHIKDNRMTIISIDPGSTGGVAIFTGPEDTTPTAVPLPYAGSVVDVHALYQIFGKYEPLVVVIEEQKMYRGTSAKAATTALSNYGRLVGTAELYAAELDAKVVLVEPRVWQKVIIPNTGKGKTKEASISYCETNYPATGLLRTRRSKRPSDGLSDAICIGDWYYSTQDRTLVN